MCKMRFIWLLMCMTRTVSAIEPPVTSVAFAPDGESVVAGSQSGLAIYSWPKLELERSVDVTMANIHDVEFAPDGTRLAVAGGDPAVNGKAQLLAWPSCEPIGVTGEHEDCVMKVAWRDNVTLATASLDHEIVIWGVQRLEAVGRLGGHSDGVTAIDFLDADGSVVSGGLDNSLRVWESDSGKMVRSLNNHTGPIQGLAVRPHSIGLPMVATISEDSTVRFWQPTIGRMVRFKKLNSVPLALVWLSDGSRLAVGCSDGHVRLIDPETASIEVDFDVFAGRVCALAIHPTDAMIIAGSNQARIKRVDYVAGNPDRVGGW